MNPYRRKIDGRTPQARALNLSGASFDASGNVTGGKDMLTRSPVNVPERTRKDIYRMGAPAGVSATESGAGRIRKASATDTRPAAAPQFAKPTTAPMMGDQLGKMDFSGAHASTAAMRAPRPAATPMRDALKVTRNPAALTGATVATVSGKYGSGSATKGPALAGTPQTPRATPIDNMTLGSGVTGIMEGYRNLLKMPAAKVEGPRMNLAGADPLKKKRGAAY